MARHHSYDVATIDPVAAFGQLQAAIEQYDNYEYVDPGTDATASYVGQASGSGYQQPAEPEKQ